MRQNKGITMISLAATVIILAILAGVSVSVGINTYESANLTGFISEMTLIQQQVNIAYDKLENGDTSVLSFGTSVDSLSQTKKQQVITALQGSSYNQFRFFSSSQLKEQLNLDGIDRDVIINFSTREVYSLTGITYKGDKYYSQYDLPGGQKNIQYVDETTAAKPEFTVSKKNIGTSEIPFTRVEISNIIYNSEAGSGKLYYGLVTDSSTTPVTVEYWDLIGAGTGTVQKDISSTGKYAIKLVDSLGNQTIKTVDIVVCNAPAISDGMYPVVYENGKWKQVDASSGTWYDYAEKKWANIMLGDAQFDASGYATTLGSMFVWIPRFAYDVEENYHTKNTGTINIRFLKGVTLEATDGKSITLNTETAGQGKWHLHPAFKNGSLDSYTQGGFNKELSGIWVAKFEASSSNPSAQLRRWRYYKLKC